MRAQLQLELQLLDAAARGSVLKLTVRSDAPAWLTGPPPLLPVPARPGPSAEGHRVPSAAA